MAKHARTQKYWSPNAPWEPVPVSLVKRPGYTADKPKTRHPDAACWYWIGKDAEGVEQCYPLVFTRDTAGTWWEYVDELWDKTGGDLDGDRNLRKLLGKAVEYIEQDVFPPSEACQGIVDDLRELLESIR